MKQVQKPVKTLLFASILVAMANGVHAGAFSLYTEGSAAAIGNFAAGIAAEGADASIGWYNPAGLVLLNKEQALLGGVGVLPSTKLTGSTTFNTEGYAPYVQTFDGLQGGKNALVPSFHYAKPLGERATAGLSLVTPFGLSTDWGTTSPVRYAATLTELLTLTLSPELGARLTDHFSIGGGLDLQWARVKFNQVLGSPAALQALAEMSPSFTPTTYDSTSNNQGDSFGVGFHAGILSAFNDNHTRIGLNYQSSIEHSFYGSSRLTGRLADPELTDPTAVFISDSLLSNDIRLPSVTTLSAYQDVNARWALLGSLVYTAWHTFKTIELDNVAAFSLENGQTLVSATTEEQYRDAWRVALGANYRVTDQWMLRFGGGYDETPTVNARRDVRLPDSDRWALSVGAHYQMRPNLGFDLGYTYLFANNDPGVDNIEYTAPLGTSTYDVRARSQNRAQLIGLQGAWTMD